MQWRKRRMIASTNIQLLMACSHRRRGRDKTVLSGPRQRCEHNCWPSFDEFCLVSTQFPNEVTLRCQVIGLIKWPNFGEWLKNTCFSLLSQLHSVSRVEPGRAVIRRQRPYSCKLETGSRRHKTVLSRPRRRCEQASRPTNKLGIWQFI